MNNPTIAEIAREHHSEEFEIAALLDITYHGPDTPILDYTPEQITEIINAVQNDRNN